MRDEYVEELHATRQRIAEACDNDFEELGKRFMRLQQQHPEQVITEIPGRETPSGREG